jgi:hypothetical protein
LPKEAAPIGGLCSEWFILGLRRTLQIVGLRTSVCKDIACIYNLTQDVENVKLKTNKFTISALERKNFGYVHKKEC